jgi:osmotically inducible protein OsmC
MAIRYAEALWEGTLREGSGHMRFGSGAFDGAYTWASRFADGEGTNPEELLGAAHAGCFSMFLSALLTKAGFAPRRIETRATVHLEDGPTIATIELDTEADVPEVSQERFDELALEAKAKCPVSKALASVDIRLNARLVG